MNLEVGIDIYTPLFMKQITNEKLLYSMGNSTQCSCGDLNGTKIQKSWDMCIRTVDSFAVWQKITQHCKETILQ